MKKRKYDVKSYKEDPPGIIVTKHTMDTLLKQEKPDQLIALYFFYAYMDVWQRSHQIRATTNYTAKGIGWSQPKVRRVKARLKEMGLVEDVINRNHLHITGHYIKINYTSRFATPTKTQRVAERGDKCFDTGNKDKCLDTLSRHSRDSRHRSSTFDKKATTKLHKTILTKKNINLDTTSWPNTFRLLRTKDKVENTRIKEVLIWYSHHLGEDYVPVAHCAKTFRAKFTRIEDAMGRADVKKEVDENGTSGIVYRKGHDGVYGYFDDSMEE